MVCGRPHTYRKDKCHEGMQGKQKTSTTHSKPWYYMEAEVNSRPSQLKSASRGQPARPSTHCGLLADTSLMLWFPKDTSLMPPLGIKMSCPDQRLLFYTNHAKPVHIYQKNNWGTSPIKSVTINKSMHSRVYCKGKNLLIKMYII